MPDKPITRLAAVREVIKDGLGKTARPLELDTSLRAVFNIDSLDSIELIMALEEELDLEIPDHLVESIDTISGMLGVLDELLGPEEPDENGYLILTDNQFITRYKPEQDSNGNYYRQRNWTNHSDAQLIDSIPVERVWTMIEDDNGNPCIDGCIRRVNRLYYIITTKPRENPQWVVLVPFTDEEAEEARENTIRAELGECTTIRVVVLGFSDEDARYVTLPYRVACTPAQIKGDKHVEIATAAAALAGVVENVTCFDEHTLGDVFRKLSHGIDWKELDPPTKWTTAEDVY